MTPTYTLSPEVQDAKDKNLPIVALESTIITHGMPYPANRETALTVETTVRDHGAIPATIAVIDGELRIGLDHDTIDKLAQKTDVMKLSRADIAFCIAQRKHGSTTVAATMIAAHLAGIAVFATGGIGGVHQGAEKTFDVSADLHELSQTPVHVVCAGAKAILDIPKTLEVLETLGVPVVTLGEKTLPAFWSRNSGIASPLSVDTVEDIANFIQARNVLNLKGGVLIANPVPADSEIDKAHMDITIAQAIADSEAAGIHGKQVTPWLLNRIVELTQGRSLQTNKALILNNAAVAAQLAIALQQS
jgi:pseudouridylate synthase